MDTKKYKDNDWSISHCLEHLNELRAPDLIDKTLRTKRLNDLGVKEYVWWTKSKGLWYRHSVGFENDEEEASTQIVHDASYSGGNDTPTVCYCRVFQINKKGMWLYSVSEKGDITKHFGHKIINGPNGILNKYLIYLSDIEEREQPYQSSKGWNIVSVARFNGYGTFKTEEEAIYFSNEIINRNIGKLNEKVIINLHRLIEVQKQNEKLFPKT